MSRCRFCRTVHVRKQLPFSSGLLLVIQQTSANGNKRQHPRLILLHSCTNAHTSTLCHRYLRFVHGW